MLKEALDRVVELANAAATPKPIDLPKEPPHIYGIVFDGQFRRQEASPANRNHNVLSLEAVMEWGKMLDGEGEERVIVWYNRSAVIALNNEDRRNKATYRLVPSEPMAFFAAVPKGGTFTRKQIEFVRILRNTLAGCYPAPFLEACRKMRFVTGSQTDGDLGRNKVSMGKKIEAEWQGNGDIPEMMVFSVPVFENLDLPRESVTCAVDPDPHGECFVLTPLPGEVERAWRGAEASIRGRLEELQVEGWVGALCYGEP